jgi:hypothetical protein
MPRSKTFDFKTQNGDTVKLTSVALQFAFKASDTTRPTDKSDFFQKFQNNLIVTWKGVTTTAIKGAWAELLADDGKLIHKLARDNDIELKQASAKKKEAPKPSQSNNITQEYIVTNLRSVLSELLNIPAQKISFETHIYDARLSARVYPDDMLGKFKSAFSAAKISISDMNNMADLQTFRDYVRYMCRKMAVEYKEPQPARDTKATGAMATRVLLDYAERGARGRIL